MTIKDTEQVAFSLNPVKSDQTRATVIGIPTWTLKGGDVVIQAALDGLSATIQAGTLGDNNILVAAVADIGSGPIALTEQLFIRVLSSRSVNLQVVVGVPTPKGG